MPASPVFDGGYGSHMPVLATAMAVSEGDILELAWDACRQSTENGDWPSSITHRRSGPGPG